MIIINILIFSLKLEENELPSPSPNPLFRNIPEILFIHFIRVICDFKSEDKRYFRHMREGKVSYLYSTVEEAVILPRSIQQPLGAGEGHRVSRIPHGGGY